VAEERNTVDTSSTDTAEIKSEIERTRVEMSETIGEIQDRLRPDHLLQQARDGVTQAAAGKARSIMNSAGETATTVANQARGAGDSVVGYVREHPVQVALVVGGLAWWMMRNRDRSDDWYGTSDPSWDDSEAMSYEGGQSMRSRVGEYASTAKETVGEYATTARQTAGEYAEAARERARRASEAARRAASTASVRMDDWVQTNPMAVGAIALAVGAAIGMSMPATEAENRAMGEARDRALERASQAASTFKDNVTRKVETAAENLVGDSIVDTVTGSPSEPMGRA
jgi:ElaB/YqjD/DUF883 family membrane-anchored ribosome-binding protein